ncbi:MAG: hypothetical protein JW781_06335, partial [Deltaproteobacteria bacterium]|nr:hypothetical protein [Candidatus Anaeroferrophillacea bacterium]
MKISRGHIGCQALVVLAVVVMVSETALTAEFFVGPQGRDDNPGSRDKPFASLEAARDAIRALKSAGGLPAGGVTVWLGAGDYPRSKSFELTARDSGTAESPITYRAAEGQMVRLLGGRSLDGLAPVTDPAVLSRLDEKARGKVLSVDLRASGIDDFGRLRSRGFGR